MGQAHIRIPAFEKYQKTTVTELRPYIPDEDLGDVSISIPDRKNGSPKLGDMIARNPDNHLDQWLVSEEYFINNFKKL